jgi:superfamily II DNA or RNA helicase
MNLYAHQKAIIDDDPKQKGLFLGTGSGKTRIALMLAEGRTLVICPKTQKEDGNWEREWATIQASQEGDTFGLKRSFKLDVVSKEVFRRDYASLPPYDTVIVDEAHTCLGVLPVTRQRNLRIIPKASQLYEALAVYLARHKPERLYLCTATIIRSPMTVWAAAKLFGYDWDFYQFRAMFYTKLPMPGREAWRPKNDDATKDMLGEMVREIGHTGRLQDYFDVPEQTFRTVYVELTEKQRDRIHDMKSEYPEPIVRIGKINQIENGVLSGDEFSAAEFFENNKIEKLLELADEFPRMVVFAKYTAQIRQIEKAFENRRICTLTGQTQHRGDLIEYANRQKECIFIAQAQISAGWELPEYPVMVFASRTYSFVDYDQALGRIQRANNIKKNLYINLIARSEVDMAIDDCLKNKQDFNERIYLDV